jgi:fumarate hydratase class I
MKKLELPLDESTVRSLKVGDEVALTGILVTARDAAHKFMMSNRPKWLQKLLKGTFVYHCGPVLTKERGKWKVVAAGPTTSIREEPYQADVIKRFGLRGAIGKGGMGAKTLSALKEHGGVYLHAVGGAAAVLSEAIKEVVDVHMLEEFGAPEAFWVMRVEDFPAVVTMDSHGNSIHDKVLEASTKKAQRLLK